MTDRAASTTALSVAMLRAAHQLLDDSPKILDDPVVLRLLDPEVIARVQTNPERFAEPNVRRLLTHVVTRSTRRWVRYVRLSPAHVGLVASHS